MNKPKDLESPGFSRGGAINKVSVWTFCAGMFACTVGLYLIMIATLNAPFQWVAIAAVAIKEAGLALMLTWKS